MRLFAPPKPRLGAVYHEDYLLSPSAQGRQGLYDVYRPLRIRNRLAKGRKSSRIQWLTPEPAALEDLERVHSPAYLREASRPAFLAAALQLPHLDPWDEDVWRSLRTAVGGTILAVRQALATGLPTANLTGGFHHAGSNRAGGFCVLNDIAVAVHSIRHDGFRGSIAVIDLDYHHGDGTEECLVDDQETWTLSLHADAWHDSGKGEVVHRTVAGDTPAADYLTLISAMLSQLDQHIQPRLIIYVAGSDPWEGDALCDMHLSAHTLFRRDVMVRRWAGQHQAALAILPGGGYGAESWRLTADFLLHLRDTDS